MKKFITIETYIRASIGEVWQAFIDSEAIQTWYTASQDWHTPHAKNDLKVGGKFLYRMEAKDKSSGFDFSGVYDVVILNEHIAYTLGDGRKVEVAFIPDSDGVRVVEIFESETENTEEEQREGWQSILVNFKKYVEGL